jgi:hypothetical protein
VLVVASSGIASLLFLGGRTAHSRFKIPIDLQDESTCNITQQMKVAELVRKADLIIWDEAPMMHRRDFEAIDRTLRDLMQLDEAQVTDKIFGGKIGVKRLGQRVIEVEIITGNNVDKRVFIPRIIMSPSGTDWPFVLRRRQFLVRVAFAITINKSQGQTFNNIGVYLSSPIYSHGQLYVVISRVTSSGNIKIFNDQGPDRYMRNVVYKEVLEL